MPKIPSHAPEGVRVWLTTPTTNAGDPGVPWVANPNEVEVVLTAPGNQVWIMGDEADSDGLPSGRAPLICVTKQLNGSYEIYIDSGTLTEQSRHHGMFFQVEPRIGEGG